MAKLHDAIKAQKDYRDGRRGVRKLAQELVVWLDFSERPALSVIPKNPTPEQEIAAFKAGRAWFDAKVVERTKQIDDMIAGDSSATPRHERDALAKILGLEPNSGDSLLDITTEARKP